MITNLEAVLQAVVNENQRSTVEAWAPIIADAVQLMDSYHYDEGAEAALTHAIERAQDREIDNHPFA